MALEDFLNQSTHSKEELTTALAVLRTFKECESTEEWFGDLFLSWQKLEVYEGYLSRLTSQK